MSPRLPRVSGDEAVRVLLRAGFTPGLPVTATDQPAFGATVEDFLAPQAPDRPDGEQRHARLEVDVIL